MKTQLELKFLYEDFERINGIDFESINPELYQEMEEASEAFDTMMAHLKDFMEVYSRGKETT